MGNLGDILFPPANGERDTNEQKQGKREEAERKNETPGSGDVTVKNGRAGWRKTGSDRSRSEALGFPSEITGYGIAEPRGPASTHNLQPAPDSRHHRLRSLHARENSGIFEPSSREYNLKV